MYKDFSADVIAYADKHRLSNEPTPIGVGGLSIVRSREPSALMNTLYNPLLCLVLQGQKEARLGERVVTFSAGESLIVSINIPTVSQVTAASPAKPYVALALEICLDTIRAIQAELELSDDDVADNASIASGISGGELVQAVKRLFELRDRSYVEQKIMAPILLREIHFRLLLESHGGMLRRLAYPDSHESRINRAILKLQKDFAEPICVQDLAALVGMSASSFHEHFKAVTATTPLQFLKDVRLLVAQQKLLATALSVSTVGFEVGFESTAHFSREYARKFGYPPSQNRRGSVQAIT
ncbi:AraC family transcriptional regulator [Reinekea blandensis]|uniref:Probable transcriptional regulator n=1 Tax=Reinekea blandensis MED297 TaxID=314283 RepID=A4BKJ5_9GAMM|nr:AraC family transcriptional regulator [Reinekea blandensis]EAR07348.1 probable transcriptional regulator [Reinekea sp. MED297] [Reinekea blandensis MED297]